MHILLHPHNTLLFHVVCKDLNKNTFSWAIDTRYDMYWITCIIACILKYETLSVQNDFTEKLLKGDAVIYTYMLCTHIDDMIVTRFCQIKFLYYKRIIQLMQS